MDINKIHNQDCLEAMKLMQDNKFDLAIVDPPYGIGDFPMTSNLKNKKGKSKKAGTYNWNNTIPTNEYFIELKRVSKERIIWGANYYNCFDDNGGAIIWYKNMGHKDLSQCEIASKSIGKKVDYIHINWQGGFLRKNSGGTWHPCQKPVKLYEWLLMNYASEGNKILDTHLGSGSIAIACHNLGYDLTGYELDKEYYDNAIKRIKNHQAQTRIF